MVYNNYVEGRAVKFSVILKSYSNFMNCGNAYVKFREERKLITHVSSVSKAIIRVCLCVICLFVCLFVRTITQK